jgi:small subunit ribosomal protein S8
MSMTDPIADMLTRIRNGQQAKLYTVSTPASKLRKCVLEVLQSEGYINGFNEGIDEQGKPCINIELRYLDGTPVIRELKKVSKPGRRVYSRITDLKKFYNGLGIAILSTSRGILSDYEARKQGVGGEVICCVF